MNIGKFNLPHIWDRVLLNTPDLNLKRHVQEVGHVNSHTPYKIIPTSPLNLNNANFPSHLITGSDHVHRTSYNLYKLQFFSSPSDLMKSTVVDESLSITTTRVLFKREST